jgi:hypothetical protein
MVNLPESYAQFDTPAAGGGVLRVGSESVRQPAPEMNSLGKTPACSGRFDLAAADFDGRR